MRSRMRYMPGRVKCAPACTCGKHAPELREKLRKIATGRKLSAEGRQKVSAAQTKHDMSRTSTYRIWGAMKQRCLNPNSAAYRWYGGRGSTVREPRVDCANFLADMGE